MFGCVLYIFNLFICCPHQEADELSLEAAKMKKFDLLDKANSKRADAKLLESEKIELEKSVEESDQAIATMSMS